MFSLRNIIAYCVFFSFRSLSIIQFLDFIDYVYSHYHNTRFAHRGLLPFPTECFEFCLAILKKKEKNEILGN